ncbi:MAG: hypothetical protein ABIJ09_19725 [Pseudomonadota bacterium]
MTRIGSPTASSTPSRTAESPGAESGTQVAGHVDGNEAEVELSHALGEHTAISGEVDLDAEGVRRAHVALEHFSGRDDRFRLSAKLGTSQMDEALRGSTVLGKVQLDMADSPLVGPLSHRFSLKVGGAHIPGDASVRSGVGPEGVTLLGVGAHYGVGLDARIGGERGVRLTGDYGVGADLFIEPAPSTESRAAFTSGTGFGAFDIAKTAGFSDITLSAHTRAAYGLGDHAELSLRHDVQYSLDDPTVRSIVDDHAVTAGARVDLGDDVTAGASLRVPLENRTRRPGEGEDGVQARLDLGWKPDPRLDVAGYAMTTGNRFSGAGVAADLAVKPNIDVGAFYRYDAQTGNHSAGVGVTIRFGGSSSKPRSTDAQRYLDRPRTDWGQDRRTDLSGNRSERPPNRAVRPGDVGGLPDLSAMSYDQAMTAIDTPEKAAALLSHGAYFEYGFHQDELAKFSPREAYARRTGVVCAEQHAVQAQALNHNGYSAHNVQFLSNGVAHVVTAYQDKSTGQWNIIDYNRIHETQGTTLQEAMQRYEPGTYEYKVLDYSDTTSRTERPRVIEVDRSAVVREVRRFWDD